jgi:hypothetical protein
MVLAVLRLDVEDGTLDQGNNTANTAASELN